MYARILRLFFILIAVVVIPLAQTGCLEKEKCKDQDSTQAADEGSDECPVTEEPTDPDGPEGPTPPDSGPIPPNPSVWTRVFSYNNGYSYENSAQSIARDSEDNIIAVGYTRATFDGKVEYQSSWSTFIVKYDKDGNKLWSDQYDFHGAVMTVADNDDIYIAGIDYYGANPDDIIVVRIPASTSGPIVGTYPSPWGTSVHSIDVDSSGSVYLGGGAYAGLYGQPKVGFGQPDAYLMKIAANDSSVAWVRQFGTESGDQIYGLKIDEADNILVAGRSGDGLDGFENGCPGDCSNGFLAKYSGSGNLIWRKMYGGPNGNTEATSLAIGPSGDIYIAGSAVSYASGQHDSNAFVSRLDANGTLIWQQFLGPPDTIGNDQFYGLAVDSSGNAYATGFSSPSFQTSAVVAKFGATGVLADTYSFGVGSTAIMGLDITVLSDGSAALAGRTVGVDFEEHVVDSDAGFLKRIKFDP